MFNFKAVNQSFLWTLLAPMHTPLITVFIKMHFNNLFLSQSSPLGLSGAWGQGFYRGVLHTWYIIKQVLNTFLLKELKDERELVISTTTSVFYFFIVHPLTHIFKFYRPIPSYLASPVTAEIALPPSPAPLPTLIRP